ncbi:MAG: hypothetical protein ACREBR_03205, partial [bacterium]
SLVGPSGNSVNIRTIVEELQPCMFGQALRRMLHYIADCRRRHPKTRILMGKFDIKAAYRRAHFHGISASESITIFENTAFIALRQTFGAMSGPNNWSCISEMICDLANDIIQTEKSEWDYRTVKSPHLEIIPALYRLQDHLPFHQAADANVNLPPNDKGLVDCYIDDLISICLDLEDKAARCSAAVVLALHTMGRPVQLYEPIPRDDLLSFKKLFGEGRMEEIKVILGWEINSRRLTIALPKEKFSSWRHDIQMLCTSRHSTFKELDTLVGRLNHVGYIIPQARHFLNRIRSFKDKYDGKKTKIHLAQRHIDDLLLWKDFISQARAGMSINLLIYRDPTHVFRSDACPHGIGGYSMFSGKAWRWKIPEGLINRVSLNCLEFAAAVVTIWIAISKDEVANGSCLYSQTDSTSTAGWMTKSSFDEHHQSAPMEVSRHLARLLIHSKSCLYSQWFAGKENNVSDSLSRDFHIPDADIAYLLLSAYPDQLPDGLTINQLPHEVDSWLTSLLRRQPESTQLPKPPTRSKLVPGTGGKSGWQASTTATTSSSTISPSPSATSPLAVSLQQFDEDSSPNDAITSWVRAQSAPPWTTYHRPFGLITGETQDMMTKDIWHTFYNANLEDTRIKTAGNVLSTPLQPKSYAPSTVSNVHPSTRPSPRY